MNVVFFFKWSYFGVFDWQLNKYSAITKFQNFAYLEGMEFYFFPNFNSFFFLWIEWSENFLQCIDRFLQSLMVSEMNWTESPGQTTKAESQNLNFFVSYFKAVFLQNDHLYGLLMNHYENLLLYFKNGSNRGPNYRISHIWKVCLTLEIVNQDKCSKLKHITVSNTFCVQQFTVSSKILCPYILLIYTCSNFP